MEHYATAIGPGERPWIGCKCGAMIQYPGMEEHLIESGIQPAWRRHREVVEWARELVAREEALEQQRQEWREQFGSA